MTKNKTIIFFNGFFLPHLGGVERYTAELVNKLKKDYKVIIVTSNDSGGPQHETIDDVEIYRLDTYGLLKNRLPLIKHNSRNKKIIRTIKNLDITNIICNTRYYSTTLLGLKIAKTKNITPIIIDHSSDYIFKPYEKLMLAKIKKYSPKYFTVSQKTADWLKTLGIESEGIFYNSITSQKNFTKDSKNKKVRLIYAGRIIKEKGIEYIIDSYNKLKKTYDISLEIIGDGPLLSKIKQENKDIIFTGYMEHEKVLKHFKKSDIFIYPTLYPEGFPTVILEAAINKCAIIATDKGGTKELISDSSIGIILKNPEDLTSELENLIKNRKHMKTLQEKVFKKVNEKFTWPKTIEVVKKALTKYEKNPQEKTKTTNTKHHVSKYLVIGTLIALFNFGLYTIIARMVIKNNDLLWLSTLISGIVTTIVAYILHSRITWKERTSNKLSIYKFFIWNFLISFLIGPFFAWLFSLITPLYNFAYNISSAVHLPFDFNFIQSTGVFILTAVVTTILNFVFYDNFVFNKKEKK